MSEEYENENGNPVEPEVEEDEAQSADAVVEEASAEEPMDVNPIIDQAEPETDPEQLQEGEGMESLSEASPVSPEDLAEQQGELVETQESIEPETEVEEKAEDVGMPEENLEMADDSDDQLAEALSAAEAIAAEAREAKAKAAQESAILEAEQEIEEEPEEEVEEVPLDDRKWYVIHCYSGYENKVRHNLEQRIETMGMKNKIFDVVVPTEEEIEVKDGKRRTVERRVFPGYILVQMLMDEDSWYVVRNTPGVTGFVGMGNEPTPLRPEEVSSIVKRMEAEAPRIKVTYKQGQKVRIIDGPFNDFIGTVSEIDMERAKVRVMVSFFGRETPVELDFLQVEKA
ncbi:MAG: transcription termination/antitermination protein NusG [Anaerolineales bacterium]|jgi:transcriptional antiterminator NusG